MTKTLWSFDAMSSLRTVQNVPWYRRLFRKLFTSDNYYKSMQPLFWVTFFHGVTPFRVVTLNNGRKTLQSSCVGYLNSVANLLLIAFCHGYTMYHNESLVGYLLMNGVSDFGSKLEVFNGIVGVMVLSVS